MKKYFIFLLLPILLFSCSIETEHSLPIQRINLMNSIDNKTISLKNFPWHSSPDRELITSLTSSYQNCTEIISGGDESTSVLSVQFPIYIEDFDRTASMNLIYRYDDPTGTTEKFVFSEYSILLVDETKKDAEKVKEQFAALFSKISDSDYQNEQLNRALEKEDAGNILTIRTSVNGEDAKILSAYSWRNIESQPQLVATYGGSYVFQFKVRCDVPE